MNELIMNGAIRITRPTDNTLKVEVLDKQGRVIYELPVAMLAKGDSFTVEPITVSIAPVSDEGRETRESRGLSLFDRLLFFYGLSKGNVRGMPEMSSRRRDEGSR